MKKFLLSAFAALACVATASADEIVLDFTTNNYGETVAGSANDKYYMEDGASFSDGAITITANKLEGSGVRFWKTDAGVQTFRVNNKSGITISCNGGVITAMKFTGNSFGYLQGEGYDDGTFEGSAESIALVNKGRDGKTGTVQIKTITITYEGGAADNRENAGLAFSEESVIAYLGEEFTAPTLSKATTAVVTYSSDKETVATVDAATGAVTLVGEGTARITAKAEANDDFRAGSASYLLTVRPAKVAGAIFTSEMGENFSFENPAEFNVWQLDSKYGLKASAYVKLEGDEAATQHTAEAVAFASVDLTGYKSATLTFSQALNQYKNGNDLIDVDAIVDYCKLVVREAGAAEWTEIGEPTAPEAFSWNFYNNAPVDLTAQCGKKVDFGFKYISTKTVAGTWEIKNINIVGEVDDEDSISEINAAAANGAIYDLQGRRVAAPVRGLYIVGGKVVRF
ncbi:MAG: hypothetical protein K2F96_07780 [Muribaculaceae bacterium]|nr:hypothetical protein [Muribaculaceae bacterium]